MKLPKLILDEFSADPLKWWQLCGQFLATIEQHCANDGMKMKYLNTLVTGRAKAVIEFMCYNGGTYRIAWDNLSTEFGRWEVVVNSLLKRFHSYPFIKSHDAAGMIKCSLIVSSCVIVLSQYCYESDLTSESVLNNAVRKLPNELKAKLRNELTYLQRFNPRIKAMRVFNAWLKDFVEVQENLKRQFGLAIHKANVLQKQEKHKSTIFASYAQMRSNQRTSGIS